MRNRIEKVAASLVLMVLALTFGPSAVARAATLDDVAKRGHLLCGINSGLLGFASQVGGKWEGFDVDFCRAVAAAIFEDDTKVDYVPLSAEERFDALRAGKVDLLSRNSTWTLGREVAYDLTFAGVWYYDGQGFMVPRTANVVSSLDLADSTVCVLRGTTSENNLADYFLANNMAHETILTGNATEALEAYGSGKCGVITSDMSQLYAWRLQLAEPDEHIILPDAISKEPLGPVVRQDDPAWATLVKWVMFTLLNAEEMGVSTQTIDDAMASTKPDVRRLVGNEGDLGSKLGVRNDWAVDVIRHVGNYGEIFERNLGANSKLGIARGMNQLWSLGGIMYAPPYR
ncbi:amino acid ABC transporter substrate-bindnig protein [Zhengella mangrovi]|uniref:Amino acid ABC transporter substrate-bindnig protein n=1 Tax=Zhengella mangrovi TaxID=1982044 RepID=A0A2G1QI00_9HYPH|nr:amino acid ABC transporter substrate-binding protein [Zhengella mangrovi]PHP64828.1 amino acid ABC transporter substrate-bindnig protein [Zhengella mangrovi]